VRILITGAGTGIGRSTAVELTRRGHDVVATARRIESLSDLDVAARLELDVTEEASVAAAIADAGPIDAVVNNAGISEPGPIEFYPREAFQRVMETNVLGPLLVSQQVIGAMRERGHGIIVNVSSIQGKVGVPFGGAYCASKHALEGFSEALHMEVAHFGIRVVIVQPGYIAQADRERVTHAHGTETYRGLHDEWDGSDQRVVGDGGRPPPAVVADAIADAIENPSTPLRVWVGRDAELVLSARANLDDAGFETAMRSVLGLTW
jgi:NAD(P)-dependent dehydrogenase (short-subunit alcohol dehydrogenase family)